MRLRSFRHRTVAGLTTVGLCVVAGPVGFVVMDALLSSPAMRPADSTFLAQAPAQPEPGTVGSAEVFAGAPRTVAGRREGGPSGVTGGRRTRRAAGSTVTSSPTSVAVTAVRPSGVTAATAAASEAPPLASVGAASTPPAAETTTPTATAGPAVADPTGVVTTDPRVDASILALLAAEQPAAPVAAPAAPVTTSVSRTATPSAAATSTGAPDTATATASRTTASAAGTMTPVGWHSGASGGAALNGSFGTWRGRPIQVTAIWADTSAQVQTEVAALDEWGSFDGDMDIAVGGLAPGETWGQAAQGAYASRWRTAARRIAARRAGRHGTTYVRFAHEMNGDWFTWKVNSSNVAAFHTSWRLFHDILAEEFPAARLVFSPNNGNHSDRTVSEIYPGDDVVDVVGVDYYDGWPSIVDAAGWTRELYRTEQGSQPYGVGAWQRFAAAHGKPLSFPEWGLQYGDHPAFIQGMHDFLAANAARPNESPAGRVVYDVYFDIAHGGNQAFMITGSANPNAASLYRALSWGAN